MSRHFFTIDEFELVQAMFNDDYTIYMNGLGPFGENTGEAISFDKDDAEFDSDFLRESYTDEIDKFSDDKKEEFDDYTAVCYSTASKMFPTLDNDYELSQIVVFNKEVGQNFQNFLQWDRCIGDIYCDEYDYNEFINDHEEFQTTEWHIAQMKKYMTEHNISVETLQQHLQVAQTKTYFFIDEIRDNLGDVEQIGEVRTTHDEIMQDFTKLMKERGFTDMNRANEIEIWDGLKGCYFDEEHDTEYVVRELKVPLS